MLERIETRHRLSTQIHSRYWEGLPTLEWAHRLCERHRELHDAYGNWDLMMCTRNRQNLTENTDNTFQRLRKNWHHGLADYLMLTSLRGIEVVVIWITGDLIVPPVPPRQLAAEKGIR